MITLPNNDYFERNGAKSEAKYWGIRVEELVTSLNDLGLFIPRLTLEEVTFILYQLVLRILTSVS